MKTFPYRITVFEGERRGRVVATKWAPPELLIDDADETAARMADEWQAEMDIEFGTVYPDKSIGHWERAGMRVRPSSNTGAVA